MKFLRLATRGFSWAPAGVAEAMMAVFMFTAWVDPNLFGPRTPYDVQFILVAEAAFLGLCYGGIHLLRARDGRIKDSLLLLPWTVVVVIFLTERAGVLALAVFALHVASSVRWIWNRGEVRKALLVRHLLVPMILAAVAAGLAAAIPFPSLGWTYYAVPEAVRVQNEHGVPNVLPTLGCLYFTMLAFARWAMTWDGTARAKETGAT